MIITEDRDAVMRHLAEAPLRNVALLKHLFLYPGNTGAVMASEGDRRATLEELVNLTMGLALSHIVEHDDGELIDESLAANPYAVTELAQLKRAVRSMLPSLPERERELIRRHYDELVEFQQIAAEWGVTKGRVSQVHAQALQRLRQLLRLAPRMDRQL